MTIDGRAVGGEVGFGVINPAKGKVFALAPDWVGSFHSIRVCVRP